MKIAIAQLNPTIGNLIYNAQKIVEATQEAAKQNVRLLLTPELSLCGYPPRDLLLYPRFIQSMHQQLKAIAESIPQDIAILVGTVTENAYAHSQGQKPLHNSMVLIEGGVIRQTFQKRLLPTYDVFDEDRYFQPGHNLNSFYLTSKQQNLKIGVTICEDLWNEDTFWGKRSYEINPIADLAESGVDIIVNLSASPYSVGKQQLREKILAHAVNKYQIPIIYTNQVGANDDLIFDGNSVALNIDGEIITRAKSFATDLVITESDLLQSSLFPLSQSTVNTQVNLREFAPASEDLENKVTAIKHHDENQEIFAALVLGVQDYARKCGFTKALIGLSGGIDSSLVAAIASVALGCDNVLGIMMPSPYSSEHSITDAVALVNNLDICYQTIPIQTGMTAYDTMLEPLFAGTEFGIAEENIQSRLRGGILMAIANKFNYLLLSTGNKSEMAVGYCTLYGDMNGGLAVIADVPKTRVFALCRWLNREQEIIPLNVINKSPSAELKPGQKDADSLPSYEILDDILDRIIGQHQSEIEIIEAGYDAVTVKKVMKLLARAEFKRRQAPPGLKITDRAFGTGWRMPIASKWLIES
jgi:NAD+ synthase (glutamine-hydrolysing)